MTDHALSCDTCYKWVTSGDFGNDPKCPIGQEIRADVRKDHAKNWKSQ